MSDALAAHAAIAAAYQAENERLQADLVEATVDRDNNAYLHEQQEKTNKTLRDELKRTEGREQNLRRELREQEKKYETLSVQHVARREKANDLVAQIDRRDNNRNAAVDLLVKAQRVRGMNPTSAHNLTTQAIQILKEQ